MNYFDQFDQEASAETLPVSGLEKRLQASGYLDMFAAEATHKRIGEDIADYLGSLPESKPDKKYTEGNPFWSALKKTATQPHKGLGNLPFTGDGSMSIGAQRAFKGYLPSMAGGLVEQVGDTVGSETVSGWGNDLTEWAGDNLKEVGELKVPSYKDVPADTWLGTFDNVLEYALGKVGEGAGVIAPTIGAGLVGGSIAAGGMAFGMGIGEMRNELEEAGVTDPATLALYSYGGGAVLGVLEKVVPVDILMSLGKEAKRKLAEHFITRVAKQAGRSSLMEASTEAAQELVQIFAVASAADKEIDPDEVIDRLIEASLAGGVAGGAAGGMAGGAKHLISKEGEQQLASGDTPADFKENTENTTDGPQPESALSEDLVEIISGGDLPESALSEDLVEIISGGDLPESALSEDLVEIISGGDLGDAMSEIASASPVVEYGKLPSGEVLSMLDSGSNIKPNEFEGLIAALENKRLYKNAEVFDITQKLLGFGPKFRFKNRAAAIKEIRNFKRQHAIGSSTENALSKIHAMVDTGQPVADSPLRGDGISGLDSPSLALSEIVDKFKKSLGLTVRQGRISLRSARGQYNSSTGVIRQRVRNDITTLAHEGGHALENRYPGLRTLMGQHRAALKPLATPGEPLSEGFAEWFRRYVENPMSAVRTAPKFYSAFEQKMKELAPKELGELQEIQKAYQEWLAAPSAGVIAKDIVTTPKLGAAEKIRSDIQTEGFGTTLMKMSQKVYTATVDDLHPIKMAVDNLVKIARQNLAPELGDGRSIGLKASDDAYKLARLARNAYGSGHMDIMEGVRGYRKTRHKGASLREALNMAVNVDGKWSEDAMNDFGAYLASRRMIGEWDRYLSGDLDTTPDKFSRADFQQAKEDIETAYPQFVDAAKKVYEFNRQMLKKKFDAGFLTEDAYSNLLKKVDYVPVLRDVSDKDSVPSGKSRTNKAHMIKRFKGSSRAIINPIQSIMSDAYETASLIARNDMYKALDALARAAGPGAGAIAERIPASQARGTRVSVSEATEQALRDAGVSEADAEGLLINQAAILGDTDVVTIWRSGEINENNEHIVYLWENGKRIPIKLMDGEAGKYLFDAMTALGGEKSNFIINALALPANMLRTAITSHPEFLFANYLRDSLAAWITTEDAIPFITNAVGAVEATRAAAGQTSELATLYSSFGGIMGGANVSSLHESRVKREIMQLEKKGIRLKSWRGAFETMEITETGTRLGVMKNAFKRGKADGLSDYEALIEAAYTATDMIDFGRHGSRTMVARRLTPFLNAQIQGLDKSVRVAMGQSDSVKYIKDAISPYIKSRTGQPLSIVEKKALPQSAKFWAKLVSVGFIGLGLSTIYADDPEYEEFSDYMRATHWFVKGPDGVWYRIPKPFELAVVSNLFERSLDHAYKGDPTAMEGFISDLWDTFALPGSPTITNLFYELATNKDLFTGRDIVSDHLLQYAPQLQYTSYNSEFSIMVGKALGVSPAETDHVMRKVGAGWSRSFFATTNQALNTDRADIPYTDMPIVRRFSKDPARGSHSVRQFWENMGRAGGEFSVAANTYKEYLDEGLQSEADEHMRNLTEEQRIYARIQAQFTGRKGGKYRKLHPLNRAKEILSTASHIRKKLIREGPEDHLTGERIIIPPAKKRVLQEILNNLQMREARNALIVLKQPGWAHKKLMPTKELMAEFEAVSPEVFSTYQYKIGKKKLPSFEGMQKVWPEVRERVLRDREDAFIADLYAEAL